MHLGTASISLEASSDKIYILNRYKTVSVIDTSTDTKEKKDIEVMRFPASLESVFIDRNSVLSKELYVAGSRDVLYALGDLPENGDVFVFSESNNKPINNTAAGQNPRFLTHIEVTKNTTIYPKIYVSNSNNDSISVINGSNHRNIKNITVGNNPGKMTINGLAKMLYVANSGGNTVSAIDIGSDEVAVGVKFNIHPAGTGKIMCKTDGNSKEYPTGTYLFIDSGTICTANSNSGFGFTGWIETLDKNSTIPLNNSSPDLTVNKYGTFTANFKPLPPPIPPEYLAPLYAIIVSSLIGWSIPTIVDKLKARNRAKTILGYHVRIEKLKADNSLDDKDIKNLDGIKADLERDYQGEKLLDNQHENVKNEISVLYKEIYDKKINLANSDSHKNDNRKQLDIIEKDIINIYADGKISDQHYQLLKDKLSKLVKPRI